VAVPKKLFVSHASFDRKFVGKLAAVLEEHGIPFWYSHTNLIGAQQWQDEIGQALKRCDWLMVVLSPKAVTSMWVKRELNYALREGRYEDRIVPVLVLYKRCDYQSLSWTLGAFQMIDFSRDFAKGCRGLLKIWGIGYRAKAAVSRKGSRRSRPKPE
jgi:hypothetical protein